MCGGCVEYKQFVFSVITKLIIIIYHQEMSDIPEDYLLLLLNDRGCEQFENKAY